MSDGLRTTLLIIAIALASVFVVVTTWAGLRIITSGATMQHRTATITVPGGPPIHAYLIPAAPGNQGWLPVPGNPAPGRVQSPR